MLTRTRLKTLLGTCIWVCFLAAISGCAYFNTFYHAKQFYGQAEKARAAEHSQPGTGGQSSTLYKQAIQKCERVVQKYPGTKWADDAYLLMGQAHYWRGDYMSAHEALQSLLELKKSPLKDQALYWQGRTSLAEENYSDAQSTWRALLKEYPKFKNREDVEYYMAQASWLGGEPEVAVGQYQTLLKRYPNGKNAAAARLDLGDLLVEQKHYEEAGKVFDYVARKGKVEDDRIQARISLGDVLEKQERYQDALKLYTDLEVSLDASARKNRMSWQARQQLELEEQRRREQAVEDSLQNANVRQQLGMANNIQKDANGNYVDPSGNIIDPNSIDPNTGLPLVPKPGTTVSGSTKTRSLQRDANDPHQKDLAQVLIREGCVLANLDRSEEAITVFQQVVAEYPSTPFAAEAQYRVGYTYEVHKEEFDRAQMAYDAVSRQGNSAFRDEAVRRSKNLVTLRTLMASASKDSASAAKSAAAETRFMRAELYLFQQENIDKAIDEYTSIEKEFKGTEHAAKAGLALAWIMEHDQGDSAKAKAKYTEVAEQYPDTEYGRRAHEVVYGPEPDPQPGDFDGPSLADLITPENQQAAWAQANGDSAAGAAPSTHLAAAGGRPSGGAMAGAALAGGAVALAHGMAPDETGPPLLTDLPADSVLMAGPGATDPNTMAGLTTPPSSNEANLHAGGSPPTPQPTSLGGPSANTTSAGAGAGATAGAAPTVAGAAGAAGSSLGDMVKATRHPETPARQTTPNDPAHAGTGTAGAAVPAGTLPDSTHAAHPDSASHTGALQTAPATPVGLDLDPMAVPVDGPSPVTKPDTTSTESKSVAKPDTTGTHAAQPKASAGKGSKSSTTSGKNSSRKSEKPHASKTGKKGAAPDSTSGKGSP